MLPWAWERAQTLPVLFESSGCFHSDTRNRLRGQSPPGLVPGLVGVAGAPSPNPLPHSQFLVPSCDHLTHDNLFALPAPFCAARAFFCILVLSFSPLFSQWLKTNRVLRFLRTEIKSQGSAGLVPSGGFGENIFSRLSSSQRPPGLRPWEPSALTAVLLCPVAHAEGTDRPFPRGAHGPSNRLGRLLLLTQQSPGSLVQCRIVLSLVLLCRSSPTLFSVYFHSPV